MENVATTIELTGFISALTSAITPEMILTILGTTAAVGVGFVLMWFGVRKVKSAFVSGLSQGKLKI